MRVLIVDDAEQLAEAVAHVLARADYEVDIANDGAIGLEYAKSEVYDAIVLDNMLPKLSGVEVAQALRQEGVATPIIMLSAKGEVDDKVGGLDAGADDYLAKPFKTSELLARIRALTRRAKHRLDGDDAVVGNVTIHPAKASVSTDSGEVVLTAKEFLLLEQLTSQVDKIVSKETLFHRAWGHEMFSEDKYVEVYMSFLRKKLREISANLDIKAVRGLGYKLTVGDYAKHV